MSTIETIVTAVEVLPHEGANKLELARIGGEGGFICVVGKGQFKDGDLAIYLEPDSVLSDDIMTDLSKNKINMSSNRLKAIKIRGIVSEGLCLNPSEWLKEMDIFEGNNVTEILGITKFEPKAPGGGNVCKAGKGIKLQYTNENFHKSTDFNRLEKQPKMFRDTPDVSATIKYHGTNFRAGWVAIPDKNLSIWQKIKRLFTGKTPREFLVGSHNTIRIPTKTEYVNTEDLDLYWKIANENFLRHTLDSGLDVIVYGEIIGPGIQKGYDYGLTSPELRVFGIKVEGRYLTRDQLEYQCQKLGLEVVEEIYRGPWDLSIRNLAQDTDYYHDKEYTREGIVVTDAEEMNNNCYHTRTVVKIINPDYLLDKTNSDNH